MVQAAWPSGWVKQPFTSENVSSHPVAWIMITVSVFSAQFTQDVYSYHQHQICLSYVTSPTRDNKRFAFTSNVIGVGWQGDFMWTTREFCSIKALITLSLCSLSIFWFCKRVGFTWPRFFPWLCVNCTKEVPVSFFLIEKSNQRAWIWCFPSRYLTSRKTNHSKFEKLVPLDKNPAETYSLYYLFFWSCLVLHCCEQLQWMITWYKYIH